MLPPHTRPTEVSTEETCAMELYGLLTKPLGHVAEQPWLLKYALFLHWKHRDISHLPQSTLQAVKKAW